MWTVEYQEREQQDHHPHARDDNRCRRTAASGSIRSNGSVLISELIVDGGGVIATMTVSYQSEPLMGFLVPVEMREIVHARPGAHYRAAPSTGSSARSRQD